MRKYCSKASRPSASESPLWSKRAHSCPKPSTVRGSTLSMAAWRLSRLSCLFLHEAYEVLPVRAAALFLGQADERVATDEAHPKRDLLDAPDLEALSLLER